ncbi:MAG: DegV family protein [Lachnospiraceae bacterium]|nr:DegV family protein [Lachnospiraceae bacterium]MDD3615006.1 DegV family protein [Lachnospiraceae bacterium]
MKNTEYKIISDGSCDLSDELVEAYGITVVPFYVSFDEKTYVKEKEEIGIRDFYERMVVNKNVYPKSSLPNVQDYVNAFTPMVQEGTAIICLCITTKFSGSMQSAVNAKNIILEEYPDAQIYVMDTTINTVLQGLFVLEAGWMCQQKVPYEEAVQKLEEIKSTGRIFFTVGSIDYLSHGGRIGKLSSIAVSALGIKPIITLKDGEIFSSGVARGRKRSLDKVIKLLMEYLEENKVKEPQKEFSICIGYGYDYEEAVMFEEYAREQIARVYGPQEKIPLFQIGATIAVHTGPYPLGFGIVKRPVL